MGILINKRQAQIEGGGRFNFHLKSFLGSP